MGIWWIIPLGHAILLLQLTSATEWSVWSACSVSCGQGIQTRSKCKSRGVEDSQCEKKEYKVCQAEDCVSKAIDYRTLQCQKYNHKPFRGRIYQWTKHINPYEKCGLTCRAQYYGFYVQLENSVPNGTPCDEDDSKELYCADGRCLKVGCDGIIGSGAVKDKCGVCRGDGSTCQQISGIFTRTHLPYGYNLVTRIPAGACEINITEMGRSRNYLALRKSDGSYIFNGNFRLSSHGHFQDAGTTFTYKRNHGQGCPGECIHAVGPVNETIDVQLLYYRRNPGITYQFFLPKHMSGNVMQKIIPHLRLRNTSSRNQESLSRNASSRTRSRANSGDHAMNDRLSNGYRRIGTRAPPVYIPSRSDLNEAQSLSLDSRRRNPYDPYRDYYQTNYWNSNRRQAASADYGRRFVSKTSQENLNGIPLAVPLGSNYNTGNSLSFSNNVPRTGLSANNIPDGLNFIWKISGFTECSKTCGGGIQQARAVCMSRGANLIVTDDNCVPKDKPKLQVVRCNTRICPPSWSSTTWSECSVTCGQGMQTRAVQCKQTVNERQDIVVSQSKCDVTQRPVSSRACTGKPCASWSIGEWRKCSTICGRGTKSRDVSCKSIEGNTVSEDKCSGLKPLSEEMCDMGTCAEGWFFSRWSATCNTDCGRGEYTRHVYCSAKDGTPLDENKCNGTKPRDRKPCRNKIPCGGYWFEGQWSTCNATCGDGVQTRDIVCIKKLGKKFLAVVGEENCANKEKPITSRSCGKLPPCPSEWYMTEWSECSASCDSGTKTRYIKCLSTNMTASDTCPSKRKPRHRHLCNKRSCEQPQLDEDPRCRDKLSTCTIVAQARLCKYEFYASKCCRACKKSKLRSKLRSKRTHRRRKS